jgi:hypothetical protein
MTIMDSIWLLSDIGILDSTGNTVDHQPFSGRLVNAGASTATKRAVIVDRSEVWVFSDNLWTCVAKSGIKLLCLAWTPDGDLLVGTEKARLAVCEDGGLVFSESFDSIPDREDWLTPWGGPPDSRSIAVSTDGTIYVNIHVGWIMRSLDGGYSWENMRGMEMDVHQVDCSSADPAIVFVATANGFYFSENHGDTFFRQTSPMPYHYQRACACLSEKDVYLTSTSKGPRSDCDALLYWSEDSGATWTQCVGLPEGIKGNINTYQIVVTGSTTALVIIDDRELYATDDCGKTWSHQATIPARTVAVMT